MQLFLFLIPDGYRGCRLSSRLKGCRKELKEQSRRGDWRHVRYVRPQEHTVSLQFTGIQQAT